MRRRSPIGCAIYGGARMSEKTDEERLAEILAAIDQSVRDWVRELEAEARQLETATSPQEAERRLRSVRELSHNIGGSAGTLGFTAISDAALPLEVRCLAMIDGGATPTVEERREIVALVGGVVNAAGEVLAPAAD